MTKPITKFSDLEKDKGKKLIQEGNDIEKLNEGKTDWEGEAKDVIRSALQNTLRQTFVNHSMFDTMRNGYKVIEDGNEKEINQIINNAIVKWKKAIQKFKI